MAQLLPGAVLGDRFIIQGVLGAGGMATVYLTRDQLRGEVVALKVLHDHLAQTPSMRERLRRELLATSRLRHPNVLVAHEIHELDGHLALSLPFHSGTTLLDQVATHGPLSPAALERLAQELASALADAHRQGIIHRDVTPSNVMLSDSGSSVLTDFGLARLEELRTATATSTLGTAGYAAPEVYQNVRAEPRSDLYSLGAVLYFAATGKGPFEASNPMGVLKRQLEEDFRPLAKVRTDLPAPLVATIESLLHRELAARPQGARAVLEDLLAGDAPEAVTSHAPAEAQAPGSSPRTAAGLVASASASTTAASAAATSTAATSTAVPLAADTALQTVSKSVNPSSQVLPTRAVAGTWTVVLEPNRRGRGPHRHWRHRRSLYRNRQDVISAWRDPLEEWSGTELGKKFRRHFERDLRSVERYLSKEGPEEKLLAAVRQELAEPGASLSVTDAMFKRRFRLMEGVDAATANRLSATAQRLGYRTWVLDASRPEDAALSADPRRAFAMRFVPTVVALMGLMAGIARLTHPGPWMLLLVPILMLFASRYQKVAHEQKQPVTDLPLAFQAARDHFALPAPVEAPALVAAPPPLPVAPVAGISQRPEVAGAGKALPTAAASVGLASPAAPVANATPATDPDSPLGRIQTLRTRTALSLQQLEASLGRCAEGLPGHVFAELMSTFQSLSRRAEALGAQAVRIQHDLDALDDASATAAVSRIEARLERLRTLEQAAGPGTLPTAFEREELERSLTSHRQILLEAEQLEAQLTLSMARLLEIGAAATRARRDLERQQSPAQSAFRLLEQLQVEVGAAALALHEVEQSLKAGASDGKEGPTRTITSGDLLKPPPALQPQLIEKVTAGKDDETARRAEAERQRLAALARTGMRQ